MTLAEAVPVLDEESRLWKESCNYETQGPERNGGACHESDSLISSHGDYEPGFPRTIGR
jgi:hypothetical protein